MTAVQHTALILLALVWVGCLIALADEYAAALFVDEDWHVVDRGRRHG